MRISDWSSDVCSSDLKDAGFATSYDIDEVLPTSDAAMMLRVQRERMNGAFFPSDRESTVGYGLTRDRLASLAAGTPILIPVPMNRGLKIAAHAAAAAQPRTHHQVSACDGNGRTPVRDSDC